jgi:hypothetical protein
LFAKAPRKELVMAVGRQKGLDRKLFPIDFWGREEYDSGSVRMDTEQAD